MLCELLLSKFHYFLILLQSHLPPIPLKINKKSKRLYIQPFRWSHSIFVVCVLGTYLFVFVILLISLRIMFFVPRPSPSYPTTLEGIFFFFYFCVSVVILSVTQLIIVNGRNCAMILNRIMTLTNEHKMKVASGRIPSACNLTENSFRTIQKATSDLLPGLLFHLGPLTILMAFLACIVYLLQYDMDPIYLFLKHLPFTQKYLVQLIGQLGKDHWVLFPTRISMTFVGCVQFWSFTPLAILAFGSMTSFVTDMLDYLISVAKGHGTVIRCHSSMTLSQEPVQIQLYLIRVVIRRYLQLDIFIKELNNLIKVHSTIWTLTFCALTIIVNYVSIKYIGSPESNFLYTVYMPACAFLLNLTTYLNLGMIADLSLLPEQLIGECRKRVKFKGNMRLLNGLFKFGLRVDQIQVKRSFVTAYFKTCLDGTVTLLLSKM